jgi:hypothetical protein
MILFSSKSRPSLVGRLLTWKPLVFIGLISYSLYLWHWPLLIFSKYPLNHETARSSAARLLASAVLATLSWKYIETPFRRRRICCRRAWLLGSAGVAMAALLFLGLAVVWSNGFPARFSGKAFRYGDPRNRVAFRNEVTLEQAMAGRFPAPISRSSFWFGVTATQWR